MRVAIIKSDSYLDKKIKSTLLDGNIKGDLLPKCNRQTVLNYDVIIVSFKNNISNLPKVLEQLVLEKEALIIHIRKNKHVGLFYNLSKDLFYLPILEMNLDFQLVFMVKQTEKYMKEIKYLSQENKDYKRKLSNLKNENKAKRILMSKGMTEPQAHRFIINSSMKERQSKNHIVNLIIEKNIDIKR